MSTFTGQPSIFSARGLALNEANLSHQLGEKMFTADGRAFRYARAGSGAALVTGNLLQAEAEDTGEQGVAIAAAAVGDTTITTTDSLTVTANEYAGGYITVTVTPGLGQTFKIQSHPAATAATVVFTIEDPVGVALTTVTRIDIVPNLYAAVIQKPATETGSIVGVAVNAISASQYGWIQVEGPANVLNDAGTIVVGNIVVASDATAGAVENGANASTEAQPVVGVAMTGIDANQNGLVNLKIG